VQLLSAGFAIHLFIPSAFVSLSANSLASLRQFPRIRIATAGALHNIGLWIFVTCFILRIDGSTFWNILGWQDVSKQGVVVRSVDWESPLYLHLPPSSIVTRLDDVRLGEEDSQWRMYLTSSYGETSEDLGWCVPKDWYEGELSVPWKQHLSDALQNSLHRAVDLITQRPRRQTIIPVS
jgi:S2P endopeptidase